MTIYTLLPRVTFEIRRAEGKRAVRQARADLEDALLHGRLKGESDHPHTAHSIVLHKHVYVWRDMFDVSVLSTSVLPVLPSSPLLLSSSAIPRCCLSLNSP